MKRWGALLGLIPALLAAAGCRTPDRPPVQDLVLLTLDTLRADAPGQGGRPGPVMPVLDRLARRGTQFAHAYTAIPITNAAHATILTGTLPRIHGCRDFGGQGRLEAPSLAEILRAEGFATAAFVSGFPLERGVSGLDRGFEVYDDDWARAAGALDRRAGDTVAAVEEYLAQLPAGGRLFLWVHFFDPHKPYVPPEEYGRLFWPGYRGTQAAPAAPVVPMVLRAPPPAAAAALDVEVAAESPAPAAASGRPPGWEPEPPDLAEMRARYLAESAYLDRQIGRLLAALAARRDPARSLFVAVADHGESFEHGYYYRHIHKLYEPLVHVPLVLAGPGLPAGRLEPAPARTVDILPTLLELLGLDEPEGLQGRSLLARLDDPAAGGPAPAVFAETPAGGESWGGPYAALVDGPAKLIRSLGSGGEEYYDLAADPGELAALDGPRVPGAPEWTGRLAGGLDAAVANLSALAGRGPGETAAPLDEEAAEKLRSLGYLQ